jgi:hypothetical protein
MGSRSRRWLNQSTHSRVAYSTSSIPFQGPRRPISSVLYSPMIVSARAVMPLCQAELSGRVSGGLRAWQISAKTWRAM